LVTIDPDGLRNSKKKKKGEKNHSINMMGDASSSIVAIKTSASGSVGGKGGGIRGGERRGPAVAVCGILPPPCAPPAPPAPPAAAAAAAAAAGERGAEGGGGGGAFVTLLPLSWQEGPPESKSPVNWSW